MRVVLDTNVLIAAVLKDGLARDIIELTATTYVLQLVVSEEILIELHRKLLSKFSRPQTDINDFLDRLRNISEVVEIVETVDIVKRDPEDNKILECALSGNADLIVTSDQDLIKIKKFRGIAIVHPKTLSWTFPEYFNKI